MSVQLVRAVIPYFWRFSKLCCFGFDFIFPTTSTFSGMAYTRLYINDQGQKLPQFQTSNQIMFILPLTYLYNLSTLPQLQRYNLGLSLMTYHLDNCQSLPTVLPAFN